MKYRSGDLNYAQTAPEPQKSQKYLYKLEKEKKNINLDGIKIDEINFEDNSNFPKYLLTNFKNLRLKFEL